MIRFLKENDDEAIVTLTRNEDGRLIFLSSFHFTRSDTQDNDGIELVMCQTNERPEKHAERNGEEERYVICHLMEVIAFLRDTTF